MCLLLYPVYKTFCAEALRVIESYSDKLPLWGGISASDAPKAVLFTLTISLVHTVQWVIWNFGFLAFDHFDLFRNYKIGRKVFEVEGTKKLMPKMFLEATISQVVTGPIIAYFLYPLFKKFGMGDFAAELPSFLQMSLVFIFAHMFNDIGFYFTHRAMHHGSVYKYWHSKHHEFKGTIGFSAEYAHPLEVVVSNQIPTIGGVFLLGTHPLLVVVWVALRLQQTYEAHSGYCFRGAVLNEFPFYLLHAESASYHDHHHTVNLGNFGGGYMDYIFGTMDHWVRDGEEEGYLKKRAVEAEKFQKNK